jgi:uncharacterized protein YecE (DUF72 family)
MKVKIGCCGFPVARNKYYKAFPVVEVQRTFYQPPELTTIQKWRNEAPPGFEFTLKAWQLITHKPTSPTYRRLRMVIPEDIKKNYGFFKPTDKVFSAWEKIDQICQILRTKIIVFQCPPSFTPIKEHKDNLKRFFNSIKRRNYYFAWEPRGEWDEKEIRDLCEELNLIYCVDPFKNKPLPGKIKYFRLHGKGGYSYRYTNEDLRALREMHYEEVPFYYMFNNVYMFEDACRFSHLFS